MGAGAVLVGATLLSTGSTPLVSTPNFPRGGVGGRVIVEVAEINPSVTLTNPTSGDVFLSPTISTTTTYRDVLFVDYTLTAPNGRTCELEQHQDSTLNGTYNGTIDLSTCEGGAYGVYTLNAHAASVSSEVSFTYSQFGLEHTIYDANADPILILHYGEGIGLVSISTTCAGSPEPVVTLDYVTERNDDSIDEVLLPFKNKNVPAGTCTATATAKKADGSAINSQSTAGATIQTTFTYTGL